MYFDPNGEQFKIWNRIFTDWAVGRIHFILKLTARVYSFSHYKVSLFYVYVYMCTRIHVYTYMCTRIHVSTGVLFYENLLYCHISALSYFDIVIFPNCHISILFCIVNSDSLGISSFIGPSIIWGLGQERKREAQWSSQVPQSTCLLDAIASPSTYPCQPVGEWVIDSFRLVQKLGCKVMITLPCRVRTFSRTFWVPANYLWTRGVSKFSPTFSSFGSFGSSKNFQELLSVIWLFTENPFSQLSIVQ